MRRNKVEEEGGVDQFPAEWAGGVSAAARDAERAVSG